MVQQRAKLLEQSNFGYGARYPKRILITDAYIETGSLISAVSSDPNRIFFFGSFDTKDPMFNTINADEKNALYSWSCSAGKMLIAAQTFPGYQSLADPWGFKLSQDLPSLIIPTEAGLKTDVFNGPFGLVGTVKQGGGAQGYFSGLPPGAIVLATDAKGRATYILDCRTHDLIIADTDVFTDMGEGSEGPYINNDADKLLANSIAFLDKMTIDPFPQVRFEDCALKTGIYLQYQWYQGDKAIDSAKTSIYKPVEDGTYKVEVTDKYGCKTMSAPMEFKRIKAPQFEDIKICKLKSVKLDAGVAETYLWSDSGRSRMNEFKEKGQYWIKVESGGCSATDTFNIEQFELPTPFLGEAHRICEADGDLKLLDAGDYAEYKWFPTGDTSRYYLVSKARDYYVIVRDNNGCTGDAGTIVKNICPTIFYIPNAFSPNRDGINEVFRVSVHSPLEDFRMDIYNIWGEMVFTSNSEFNGWDGTYNGSASSQGAYYYTIHYTGYTDQYKLRKQSLSGVFHLIR